MLFQHQDSAIKLSCKIPSLLLNITFISFYASAAISSTFFPPN